MQAEAPHLNHDRSLRELLEQECPTTTNYKGEPFLSLAALQRVLTRDRISQWIIQHYRPNESEPSSQHLDLSDTICSKSYLLFAVLVLANLEHLTFRVLELGLNDAILFDEKDFVSKCKDIKLTAAKWNRLTKCRNRIGVVLDHATHQDIAKDWVLPYLKRENLDRAGSYGVIYRVTIAPGHLKGYNKVRYQFSRIFAFEDEYSSRVYLRQSWLRNRYVGEVVAALING